MEKLDLQLLEINLLTKFHSALGKDAKFHDEKRQSVPEVPHVSSMVYDCLRRAYYDLTTSYSILDSQSSIRVWIGRKLHELQVIEGSMMEFYLAWNNILQGTIDEYSENIILEKKTVRHTPTKIQEHHKKQVELYNLLLIKNDFEPATIGAIMYINVNDAHIKVFPFKLEKSLLIEYEKEILKKYEILSKCLKLKILPPRKIQQWQTGSIGTVCDYCRFYARCWQEDFIDTTIQANQIQVKE
jgi:hypothetical protein